MFITTELFGKFHSPKAPLRLNRARLDNAPPQELEQLFQSCLPAGLLAQAEEGPHSRDRVYSLSLTFWTFLWQTLHRASCRSAVRKLMAWFALRHRPVPSEDDSPYCQARRRLPRQILQRALQASAQAAQQRAAQQWRFHDKEVLVGDGTMSSAADTKPNQRAFPQYARQKPGCGFPLVRWVALFSLATGALLEVAVGNKYKSELKLLRQIWDRLKAGMILLADRGFCDLVTIAALHLRQVDSVMRLHATRDHDLRKGKRLGKADRLVVWQKPQRPTRTATKKLWRSLPDQLTLRLICCPISIPGFRTHKLFLVTTLLDPSVYPPAELAALYLRRWRAELFLRDIKITLGIDYLTCKTPAMIYRELMMHLIGYNLIRCLMVQAANTYDVDLQRISFKGSLDTLHHFSLVINAARSQNHRTQLIVAMLEVLAGDPLPLRPNRFEPRRCKRRPKAYAFLVRPRNQMKAQILQGKKRKYQGS